MVANRISKLSCTEDVFKEEIPTYQISMKVSGYKEELKLIKPEARTQKGGGGGKNKRRNRGKIWLNPPT